MKKSLLGFTMIELLMVIMIVAILGATALPQFLNFRTEGKSAAVRSVLSSVRTGIKLQNTQKVLRCSNSSVSGSPSVISLAANDITAGGDCDTSSIVDPAERRFVDSPSFPPNPVTGINTVLECTNGSYCGNLAPGDKVSRCTQGCSGAPLSGGWCYAPALGEFWADSASNGGTCVDDDTCTLECGF